MIVGKTVAPKTMSGGPKSILNYVNIYSFFLCIILQRTLSTTKSGTNGSGVFYWVNDLIRHFKDLTEIQDFQKKTNRQTIPDVFTT